MGSIDENRYRYSIDTLAKVSIVSILVSILRYLSKNPHYKLHIHKLVTYFDLRTSNFFEIFVFLTFAPFLLRLRLFHFRFFFFGIFCHYSSDNTKYRYLSKVSILNDTKRYRYSIDSIDTISHHYSVWIMDAALSDPVFSTPNIYTRHCNLMWTSCSFPAKTCGERMAVYHMDTVHLFQCDLLLLQNRPQILTEKNPNV